MAASAFGLAAIRPAIAAWLEATPRQTAGPFYHPMEPLSVDNDLLYHQDPESLADGEVIYIRGRLLDQTGKPIKDARIEIWQANAMVATTIRDTPIRIYHSIRTFSALATHSRTGGTLSFPEHQTRTLFGQLGMATAAAHSFCGHSQRRFTMVDTDVLRRRSINKRDFLLRNLPSDARGTGNRRFPNDQNAPDARTKLGEFDIILGMPGVTRDKA